MTRARWLKVDWSGPLTEGLSFEESVAAVTLEQWAYVGRCFDGVAANMRRALADFEEALVRAAEEAQRSGTATSDPDQEQIL